MAHLIDKDALIAEIGKLKENPPCYITMAEKGAYIEGVDDAENVINNLEVKEADLTKEIEKCLKKYHMLAVGKKEFTDIANYFFELGFKTQ
jgi:hypothetical protein